jgi:hypothetical protein
MSMGKAEPATEPPQLSALPVPSPASTGRVPLSLVVTGFSSCRVGYLCMHEISGLLAYVGLFLSGMLAGVNDCTVDNGSCASRHESCYNTKGSDCGGLECRVECQYASCSVDTNSVAVPGEPAIACDEAGNQPFGLDPTSKCAVFYNPTLDSNGDRVPLDGGRPMCFYGGAVDESWKTSTLLIIFVAGIVPGLFGAHGVRLPRPHSDDTEASDSVDLPMVHAVVAKADREAVRLLLCVIVCASQSLTATQWGGYATNKTVTERLEVVRSQVAQQLPLSTAVLNACAFLTLTSESCVAHAGLLLGSTASAVALGWSAHSWSCMPVTPF